MTFSTSCGPIGKIFFEAARTFQSYRASLILAIRCFLGVLLVCTLLPGALETGLTPYWYLCIWVFCISAVEHQGRIQGGGGGGGVVGVATPPFALPS